MLNILLVIVIVFIFLVLFEIVLRIAAPKQMVIDKFIATNDSRNYENKPNIEYTESGNIYHINKDGLRSDIDYDGKNKQRIALLGDSVAFGMKVNYTQTFGYILQHEMLQRYEVINFGVSGYDTDAEITALKVKVLQYKPDVVVLNFVMNDIEPSSVEFHTDEKKECILPIIKLKVSCEIKDAIRNIKAVDFFYSRIRNLFYNKVNDYYTIAWSDDALYQSNILNPLNEFKSICTTNNIKCGVVIFPLLQFDSMTYRWEPQEQKLITDLQKLGLSYISLRSAFQQHDASELGGTADDILHPNAFGHAIAAAEIGKFIKEIMAH